MTQKRKTPVRGRGTGGKRKNTYTGNYSTRVAPINKILPLLDAVPYGKSRWKAACPAHGGKDRNLQVTECSDGTILLKCWSHGCTADEICGALCLKLRDLFPRDPNWRPEPEKVITLFDKVEMMAFIMAHEQNLRLQVPTSTHDQRLYRQYQRVICSPFTPEEVIGAHLFCLEYHAAVKRGESPDKEADEKFMVCVDVRRAVGGYLPYEY